MKVLSPKEAALLARGVYRLREDSISTIHDRGQQLGCEGMFTADDDAKFQGKTGALAWKRLTGCGYIATGEGLHAGEVLVATRGTAMAVDWLSNLNIGLQFGPGGYLVHAGFNEVWKSFKNELDAFLKNRNPSRIHCVGHSLGGALAALNADYFSSNGVAEVCLYTFGAPRSGDGLYARSLTHRLGARQIFRVSHPADPVPMIPLFPFWHLPHDRKGIQLSGSEGALISVGAHSMEGSYIPAMSDQTWTSLTAGSGGDDEIQVKSWLESAAQGKGSFLVGSASLLTMIGRALKWLLAAARDVLLGAIGCSLAVGATVLDQLAWLLSRGASLSKELGKHITTLLSAIFAFLGRKLAQAVDLGVAFVRWVLDLLYSALSGWARRALNVTV